MCLFLRNAIICGIVLTFQGHPTNSQPLIPCVEMQQPQHSYGYMLQGRHGLQWPPHGKETCSLALG